MGGRQGLASTNKTKTYEEKCSLKLFKCKQERTKRGNVTDKNILRVSLQELVALTDTEALWV